jgi:dipeptidase E
MKLFLTSNALENEKVAVYFKTIFADRGMKDLSVLLITVQDSESDAFYLEKTMKELNDVGVVDIDIFKLRTEKFDSKREYDLIYVCGGNTFIYLDRIRKTGLDKFIIDNVKSGRSVYVGASAGSIIAGPDIEICGYGNCGDPNDIGLKDLRGLNLINLVIYPHFTEDLREELEEFKKEHNLNILELRDDQAVYLDYADMDKLTDVVTPVFVN